MKQIWKYPITPSVNVIEMPEGAEILCVQIQGETPCIWALVNPNNELESRAFQTFGTGHNVMTGIGRYIGTFQIDNGAFVFHTFEIL